MSIWQIAVPVADICQRPDGARTRQAQFGEALTVLGRRAGWAEVSLLRDGYPGFVRESELREAPAPTHRISARATFVYSAADFKSPETYSLGYGAQVCVLSETGVFGALAGGGYLPLVHLSPLNAPERDPVAVALLFLGTPYLWGGNSVFGIDCSGLVQATLLACGINCPGDSGPQSALGKAASGAPQSGDLLFWKGHVALVADAQRLIHANVFQMAVCYEPVALAIARIEAQGDGPVIAHRRL